MDHVVDTQLELYNSYKLATEITEKLCLYLTQATWFSSVTSWQSGSWQHNQEN